MRILYFGTSSFAIPALEALVAQGHTVVALVTQPDRPAGRGGRMTAPATKPIAETLGIPVLQPESCRTPEFLETARSLAPDLSVVAAYGQFLPDALLQVPPCGSVNLHGSLLPKYRGAAPIQRAIWHGEAVSGVCLMWMVRKMDAGDVIACVEEPILPEDHAGSLTEKLARDAAAVLIDWLPALERGDAPHWPQNPDAVTFAPPISKEERMIDWTQPAMSIWQQIRALAPAPSAVTMFRGTPLKILEAQLLVGDDVQKYALALAGQPGSIVENQTKSGLNVVTGDGVLQLTLVQPAGKRPMPGADFLRGNRITPGEGFTR